MSSEYPPAAFDPDAVTAGLHGTWSFPVIEEPAWIGLLHFTDTGRAIQFLTDPQQQKKLGELRLWYSIESATNLRFRPKPDHQGWLRSYHFADRSMTLSHGDLSWTCKHPSPEEVPSWFHQALTSALART